MKLHHIFYFFHLHTRKFYFYLCSRSTILSTRGHFPYLPATVCLPYSRSLVLAAWGGIFHIFLHGHVITYKHKYSLRECLGFWFEVSAPCFSCWVTAQGSPSQFICVAPARGGVRSHELDSLLLMQPFSYLTFIVFSVFAISDSAWTSSLT